MSQRTDHQRHAGLITSSYSEARDRLTHDALVQSMAHQMVADLGGASGALEHVGQIPWHFIQSAAAEYNRRGGTDHDHHIVAIAEAVVQILKAAA